MTTLLFFDRSPAAGLPVAAPADLVRPERQWLCRACANPITRPTDAIDRAGAHRHRFANPGGQTFTIGCFRSAPGCRPEGRAWRQFSWFPGYAWRVAVCGRCDTHLGWRFEGQGRFFGLILKHLRTAG